MSDDVLRRSAWGAVALSAALVLALPGMPSAFAAPMLTSVLLLGPGALLADRLPMPGARVGRWAMVMLLGCFAVGAPFVVLRMCGVPGLLAARGLVALVGILALVHACVAARRLESAAPARIVEWVPAAAWAAVVLAMLVSIPSLAPRADGWFHAGVTLQLLDRVPPPEDPYFAGLRLLYFWGTHAWASLWLLLSPGLSVWTPWIALNVASAAAILLAVAALTRVLGATPRVAGFAAALAVVAWSPLGWMQVAARAAVGEVRGWAEVVRLVAAGADPLMDLVARGQLHASMAFHGDKSFVLTPFGSGLALFVLGLTALIEMSRADRQAITFGVVVAAALFMHTVAGDVLVLLAAIQGMLLLPTLVRGMPAARSRLIALVLAVAAAVLVMAPYVLAVSGGKQGQLALGLSRAAVSTMLLGMGPVLLLAAVALRSPIPARGTLIVMLCSLLFAGLFVDLPESNQSKFFNFLMLAIVPLATMQLARWLAPTGRTSAMRWAAVSIVFLPTPALCLWAHLTEHGQSRLSWHAPAREVAELFHWAKSATTPETVFADLGGARELFTITGRSVLWGGPDGERDWGHAPTALELRRQTVRALCTGAPVPAEGLSLLRTLGRPIVIVCRASVPETAGARRRALDDPTHHRLLREAGGVTLIAWDDWR